MTLETLWVAVQAAVQEERAPLKPGESRPVLPLLAYLSDDEQVRLRQAARALRREHPEVFNRQHERTLAWLIVDLLAQRAHAPTLSELADALAADEEDQGPWLISTPLSNITMDRPVVRLNDTAVLWRADVSTDWLDGGFGWPEEGEEEVFRILGDKPRQLTRWTRLSGGERLDTRRGAALVTVETGGPAVARARALARARYATATWAILSPPEQGELLPEAGSMVPLPWWEINVPYKKLESGNRIPKARSSTGQIYAKAEYPAPSESTLRVAFNAMDVVEERRCAQALLSASLAVVQASRGSRFELSERLRFVHVAIETLIAERPGEASSRQRWDRVSEYYGAWAALKDAGYLREDIAEIRERLQSARNIATHGSDAVLLDLGFPGSKNRPTLGRARDLAGAELGISGLSADMVPLLSAVTRVVRELLVDMDAHGWDDAVFEERFA